MANTNIPVLERHVEAQPTSVPDFQSAMEANAQSQNYLSAIGTQVAQTASNAQAVALGTESGKKPHGDLTPSISEFDKNFEQSYQTQAHATLALQGQKLLEDTQVEMSKSPRLTPQQVALTNKQLQTGLTKIADNAPLAVRGPLQAQFDSQVMQQNTHYQEKMLQDSREDEKNKLVNASDLYVKNTQEFGINGDAKGSKQSMESAIQAANILEKHKYITPEEARQRRENATQAYINGEQTHEAVKAYKEDKYPEFAKKYAKSGPPAGMTNEQYQIAGNHFQEQVNFLHGLTVQDENLKSASFRTQVVEDINAAGRNLLNHQSEVSETKFQEDKLYYLQALKTRRATTAEADELTNAWGNREVYARSSDKIKDSAFDSQVTRKIITARNSGSPVSMSEAENQVAGAAAGPVPRMIKLMNLKLASPNPQDIEDAGKTISYMHALKKDSNLHGVTDENMALLAKYQALRQTGTNAVEAAQQAYENVYNQKDGRKKILDENWHEIESTVIRPAGKLNYYGQLTGIDTATLTDPQGFTEQVETLLSSNYNHLNGDLNTAKTVTQQAIQRTYGETYVNGKKETTFYPLEDVVGLHDGAGFIQEDIINQVNEKIAPIKEAFDKGNSQYYWAIEPTISHEKIYKYGILQKPIKASSTISASPMTGLQTPHIELQNPITSQKGAKIVNAASMQRNPFNNHQPIMIRREWKDGHVERYPLIVKSDPWLVKISNSGKPYGGSWDIVLGTERGWKPLQRLDPMQSDLISYTPDIAKIKANAAKAHSGNK